MRLLNVRVTNLCEKIFRVTAALMRMFASRNIFRLADNTRHYELCQIFSPWCNPFAEWFVDWLVGVTAADTASTWSSSLYPFLLPLKFSFPLTADTQLVVDDFFDFHSFIVSRRWFFLFIFSLAARVYLYQIFLSSLLQRNEKLIFLLLFVGKLFNGTFS